MLYIKIGAPFLRNRIDSYDRGKQFFSVFVNFLKVMWCTTQHVSISILEPCNNDNPAMHFYLRVSLINFPLQNNPVVLKIIGPHFSTKICLKFSKKEHGVL